MLIRSALVALTLGFAALPVLGQEAVPSDTTVPGTVSGAVRAEVATLAETLRLADIIAVMREEGLDYGATLEEQMFPGAGGTGWPATVALIYDGARMRAAFEAAFADELASDPALIPDMQAFFASDLGQKVLALEIEARRALLDDTTEAAAAIAWSDLRDSGGPRHDLLVRFAEVNDLVESNVMGALNANLAFYQGMASSGAFDDTMTQEQMLTDVWTQEDSIRTETEDWLFPYLTLSYQPLDDAELQAYVDFSATPAGKRLNTALFAAFDTVFSDISHALGAAAARQMQGEDI